MESSEFSSNRIEELSLNAWPALQTLLYDGWVLRFAGGYTRRANSVNPLYASSLPLEEKIAACEEIYRSQGLPVIFKLTLEPRLADLDAELDQRGYQADAFTSVQLMDLQAGSFSGDIPGFIVYETLTEDWFSAFCALSGTPDRHLAPMRQLLNLILPRHSFAMLQADGRPVACGLSVQQDSFIGLYDIVVAREQRRKGYGRHIMEELLAQGQRQGAHTAYLQVMLNNEPALRLYKGLGFKEANRYWYRVG
jgi:ribosomal protein S18 acetylase RimI-like enzyme